MKKRTDQLSIQRCKGREQGRCKAIIHAMDAKATARYSDSFH
jgi:hypothetical protein